MIILMGQIGTGKSTQGHLLAESLHCPWLSTGELLRKNPTKEQQQKLTSGQLIGDEELLPMLQNEFRRINARQNECILDGFPRTIEQTKWLIDRFKGGELYLTTIIFLQASEPAMVKRLLLRGRPDDTEATIDERFKKFAEATLPVLDYFKSQGYQIHEVNAEASVEEIAADIRHVLKIG